MMLKIRLKKQDIKWCMFVLLGATYAVFQIKAIMYIALLLQILALVQSYVLYPDKIQQELIDLFLISLVLPDNYCVIPIVLGAYCIDTTKKISKSNLAVLGVVAIFLFINIIVNRVRLNNLVMAVIYMLPFWLMNNVAQTLLSEKQQEILHFCSSLKRIVLMEVIAVLAFIIAHFDVVLYHSQGDGDLDWVTGTLGMYQCNVLMFICSCAVFVFWTESAYANKKATFWMLVAGLLTVSTGTASYLLIFVAVITIVMLLSNNISTNQKNKIFVCLSAISLCFILVSPAWMVRDVMRMVDIDYILWRIPKLQYYINTFFEIPQKEGLLEFLFGTGLGQYSSRTAETCAGGYIGLYDRFFAPYETSIRYKYIASLDYGEGLMAFPASSIIATQGELGLLGLALLLFFFWRKITGAKDTRAKILVMYFFGIMFIENTLEFAKYGVLFWLAYYACTYFKNTQQISECNI